MCSVGQEGWRTKESVMRPPGGRTARTPGGRTVRTGWGWLQGGQDRQEVAAGWLARARRVAPPALDGPQPSGMHTLLPPTMSYCIYSLLYTLLYSE